MSLGDELIAAGKDYGWQLNFEGEFFTGDASPTVWPHRLPTEGKLEISLSKEGLQDDIGKLYSIVCESGKKAYTSDVLRVEKGANGNAALLYWTLLHAKVLQDKAPAEQDYTININLPAYLQESVEDAHIHLLQSDHLRGPDAERFNVHEMFTKEFCFPGYVGSMGFAATSLKIKKEFRLVRQDAGAAQDQAA
jgi:hypothetical protein